MARDILYNLSYFITYVSSKMLPLPLVDGVLGTDGIMSILTVDSMSGEEALRSECISSSGLRSLARSAVSMLGFANVMLSQPCMHRISWNELSAASSNPSWQLAVSDFRRVSQYSSPSQAVMMRCSTASNVVGNSTRWASGQRNHGNSKHYQKPEQ